MKKPAKVNCPICKKATEFSPENPHRPFCSERCKLIDLGDWASESHRIEGSPVFDDVMSEDLDNPTHH
ncbi:DNA gyrase inhibitor YacG [Biformimicrobium ophioploci]|uniref:DNA gyrase inhibitor YacG n=1 Tax=Biformimicrobium ophioploci TaxID=3036711 RepID=A0ABQ6LX19_9GAMM|nr:DNA gyrase inhibitor YacG [Microbulbifer sp. NKW57]GMG86658.1 DNA gyrase inhibitor YacG [Microbulbifer sp. NKW57]